MSRSRHIIKLIVTIHQTENMIDQLSYPQRSAQLFDIIVDCAPLSIKAWNSNRKGKKEHLN